MGRKEYRKYVNAAEAFAGDVSTDVLSREQLRKVWDNLLFSKTAIETMAGLRPYYEREILFDYVLDVQLIADSRAALSERFTYGTDDDDYDAPQDFHVVKSEVIDGVEYAMVLLTQEKGTVTDAWVVICVMKRNQKGDVVNE